MSAFGNSPLVLGGNSLSVPSGSTPVGGPSSSTDTAMARWSGTGGNLLQDTPGFLVAAQTSTATSGTILNTRILPIYNQASGTAANTDLLINRTETAVGSGAQYLFQAQVGGSDRVLFGNTGGLGLGGNLNLSAGGTAALTTGARFQLSGGLSRSSWTTSGVLFRVDASTSTDTSTATSGTAPTAVFASFAQPTLAATNATVTTTDAATVYIAAAPAAGTNQTITRSHALWIDAGSFRLDGTSGAGVGAGTLANAPSAGDPDKWIPINSDGTQYWIPAWAA